MSSLELYVRLAFAVALLLAPGWCLAWALGVRSVSAVLGWSLTLLFVAFTLTFLLASSLTTAIALYAIAGLAALLAMVVRRPVSTVLERGVPGRWAAAAAGLLLGIILWHVAGTVQGDGLFHLARVQKLLAFDDLTLHRVLEFSPKTNAFARSSETPLAADAVIVDEVSMLDTPLAAALFGAVPERAQLILVGDVDQLPSVGPGRVLADVIASRATTVVRLTEIFRQAASSAIVVNAHRVNHGELPDLRTHDGSDFYFIERDEPEAALATIVEVVAERIPRRWGLDAVDDVQVLAPMHRGEVGAQNLNATLQARLNPPRAGAAEITIGRRNFRVGDKVIQQKNDYDRDVYNGDVGRVTAITNYDHDEDGREVIVEIDGRPIPYEIGELDQLGHAFALSVHKSQGSEYPAVVVPIVTQHYLLLKRNLLYTAMTRGKKLVVLVGSKKALGIAVRSDDTKQRWTWLAERIREA